LAPTSNSPRPLLATATIAASDSGAPVQSATKPLLPSKPHSPSGFLTEPETHAVLTDLDRLAAMLTKLAGFNA
jgi:hypothetical protein